MYINVNKCKKCSNYNFYNSYLHSQSTLHTECHMRMLYAFTTRRLSNPLIAKCGLQCGLTVTVIYSFLHLYTFSISIGERANFIFILFY